MKVFERIVVGLDGSAVSEAALHSGVELAERLGLPLLLVRVADLAKVRWGSNEAAEAYAQLSSEMTREKNEAQQYLNRVAQPLRDQGLAVTTDVRSGTAARELLEVATPTDLLVVAPHGRHGLQRWLLGSVAEEVARKAPGPVLIARS